MPPVVLFHCPLPEGVFKMQPIHDWSSLPFAIYTSLVESEPFLSLTVLRPANHEI